MFLYHSNPSNHPENRFIKCSSFYLPKSWRCLTMHHEYVRFMLHLLKSGREGEGLGLLFLNFLDPPLDIRWYTTRGSCITRTYFKLVQQDLLTCLSWLFYISGVFVNLFFLAYLISPKFCHRFVGYLEEEAVKTYTHCLEVHLTQTFSLCSACRTKIMTLRLLGESNEWKKSGITINY